MVYGAKVLLSCEMSDHKIVGGLFDLLFHKPVGIPNGALTNAESQ